MVSHIVTKGFKKLVTQPATLASFTRSSVAYNPETGEQVGINTPRYVDGPFAGMKALYVEEGTTNNVPNGNFSNGTTGWYTGSSQHYDVMQVIQDSEKGLVLKVHGKSDAIGAWDGLRRDTTPTEFETTAKYIVASVDVKTDSDYQVIDSVSTVLYFHHWVYTVEEGWAKYSDVVLGLPSGANNWQRLVLVVDMPATRSGYTVTKHKIVSVSPRTFRGTMYRTNIQIEYRNAPYATSFTDGTRSPEILTIPTAGVLNPQEGTVECWLPAGRRSYAANFPLQFILDIGGTGLSGANLQITTEGKLQACIGNGSVLDALTSAAILDPAQAYYIAFRWWPGYYAISVNGATVTRAFNHNFVPYANMSIGSHGGTQRWLDGLIDDLRISSRARTDAEILAAYQSNAPLPVDEWTTYLLPLNESLDAYGPAYVSIPSASTRIVSGTPGTRIVLISS